MPSDLYLAAGVLSLISADLVATVVVIELTLVRIEKWKRHICQAHLDCQNYKR